MEYLYLDTALLAVPNYAIDGNSAQELIDRVLHFSDVASAPSDIPLRLVISSLAEATLWGVHHAPERDQIAEFMDLMEISDYYSPNDLLRSYNTILDRASRSAELCCVEITAFNNFSANPQLGQALAPAILASETQRILLNVSILNQLERGWSVGSSLNGATCTLYELNGDVTEATGPQAEMVGELPSRHAGGAYVVPRVEALAGSAEHLWARASSDQEIHFAITLGAIALRRAAGLNSELSSLRRFRLGPLLLDSLTEHGCCGVGRFSSATRLLLTQLVAGLCGREIGKFGRPQQEVRDFDGAKAFRVHLTKGKLGLRLMFWTAGENIEFANVGVKKALEIEVGGKGNFIELDLVNVL
ncbi:hypothetical protein [Rhizobium ruizarguesonis]|uniref:hypothetical protein n=1 Tax=Rhizobium ruizarguesonis TaxID=2081791 RepID=UPI001030B7CC|nr:hypothetical protein [Rhizobium ruizarguesonis]TAW18725.1 hypothetical protein ELI25_24470 [Rhizobium ruizarguesonis]TAZ54402.1 hypothetical protein ELH76_26315 [Rhizobium ruizarguesonis]